MRQNDKELLIMDLCARLPYGVIVYLKYDENTSVTREMGLGSLHDIMFDSAEGKPYLRVMSSMTEEEKEELKNLFDAEEVTSDFICYLEGGTLEEYLSHISYSFCSEIIDWLNEHHFDYRGLIEKGLALEAQEDMYDLNYEARK